MIGYALPIGNDKHALWFPAPQLPWGELKHLGDTVTILAADADLEVDSIPQLCHDNIFRYEVRTSLGQWGFALGRMMLWGLIWLVGMDQPLEDLVGGLYLLLGLPLFLSLLISTYRSHDATVRARFGSLFFDPQVKVIQSDRMARLENLFKSGGAVEVLHHIDELGLGHLREFYRRAAWQPSWSCPPPTGAGIL